MKRITRAIAFLVLGYLAIMGGMYTFQRSIIYKPTLQKPQLNVSILPSAQAVVISTPDGVELNGWWIAPKDEGNPTFLYLHGNGGNLTDREVRFKLMTEQGEGLLAIDWRGFGGSSGTPTEQGLHIDALSAYEWLAQKVDVKNIVIFGESLGTSPATKLASTHKTKALILDSPFVSLLQMAQMQYGWLPVEKLLHDTYRTDLWIAEVPAPLLVLHGDADKIVPYAQGQKLFALSQSPRKQFYTFPNGGHIVSYKLNGAQVVRDFLKSH